MSGRSRSVIASWHEQDIAHDDITLHVHRAGNPAGPTLLLAHGLSDSGRCWWRVVEALGGELDVVMLDARNHGQSSTAIDSTTTPVGDVAVVIDALGLDRPMLMGHSLGARTIAAFVAEHPRCASQLVLVDPPYRAADEKSVGRDPARREAVRAWLASFADMTHEEITEVGRRRHSDWSPDELPTWVESKQQVRTAAADDFPSTPWGDVVVALDCPTVLVHGESDRGGIVTDEVARRIVELNPRVTSVQIADSGHGIHREQFDAFMTAIRPALLQ